MDPARKPKRFFTPEQKFQILQAIEADVKAGMKVGDALVKHNVANSNYSKWKHQLSVGVKSSLRNGKPPLDRDKRRLEREIEQRVLLTAALSSVS